MILLPIGHEEEGVRRLPWISFGVMILCALAFFATGRQALFAEDDTEVSEEVLAVLEYYLEHPYLELDPDFRQKFLPADGEDEQFEAMLEAYRSMAGPPPTNAAVRESEQEVLDGLMAGALESFEDHPLMRWGLVPNDISLVTLFTHMFLHVGWLHLIGNMLLFYLAGPFIEDVWGRPLFLAFYLVAGCVAAFFHIATNPGSSVPMIGASGAISGVMGAFLVRYWSTKIRFFYMVGIFFRGTFSAPAWIMLPLWFGQQVFYALLTRNLGDEGGVAYWAHIGGFLCGLGAAGAIKAARVEERFINPALEGKVHSTVVSNEGVERALEMQQAGRIDEALELLAKETRRSPSNLDAALAFWSLAVEAGREGQAAPAALRAIQLQVRAGDEEHALAMWDELHERVSGVEVPLPALIRMVHVLTEHGRREQAMTAVRNALLAAGATPGAATAVRIATLAASLDPTVSRAAARLALSQKDLDPDARVQAERLLEGMGSAQSRPTPSVDNPAEPLKLA
jgi:membrane associated rhomboid family serine protease